MHVKLAIALLVLITALVNAEPPSGNYGHGGGGGGYHQQQPTKIKHSGPSKIFGWLGSRFAKIPYFLPKIPPFPKYQVPHKLPSYQAAIVLPQHPGTSDHGSQFETSYGAPESFQSHGGQNESPEKVVISQTDDGQYQPDGHYQADGPPQDYYPESPQSQHAPAQGPAYDFIPEFKAHSTNDIDVVQSQLVSYNKEVIPPNSGWQDGYADQGTAPAAPYPVSIPPLQNTIPRPASKTVVKHVPVVPHSTGPDYFNTAYGSNKGSSSEQGQGSYQQSYNQDGFYQSQSYSQEQREQLPGYSAPTQPNQQYQYQQQYQQQQYQEPSYQSVKSQQFTYNDAMAQKVQPQQQYQRPQQNYAPQGYAAPAPTQASYTAQAASQAGYAAAQVASQGGYAAPTATPKPVYQAPHSAANGFVSSGIPGVKILSQQDDGGNPVFEVLADADAPDFNGHPFDINKLIAMIEPGAELAGAPELSQAASETQNVYQAPPPNPTASTASGTGDLLISESDPRPSLLALNSTGSALKPKSPSKKPIYSFLPKPTPNEAAGNKSSSIKDIMDFFQLTGGKGYIVVEKKRSRPNLTDSDSDADHFLDQDDDDFTDGISRVNITSDSIPFLSQNTDFVEQPQASPSPPPAAAQPPRYYPTVPKSPMPSTTPPPMVFFAVRATTRHPNHNYNVPEEPQSSDDSGKINDFLDTVSGSEDDDQIFAESNIKSIAITVTPPPRKVVEMERPTTPASVVAKPEDDAKIKEVTKSSVVKRPAPVYKAGRKS